MKFRSFSKFVTPNTDKPTLKPRLEKNEILNQIQVLEERGFKTGVKVRINNEPKSLTIIGFNTRQYGPHQFLTHPLVVNDNGEERLVGVDELIEIIDES